MCDVIVSVTAALTLTLTDRHAVFTISRVFDWVAQFGGFFWALGWVVGCQKWVIQFGGFFRWPERVLGRGPWVNCSLICAIVGSQRRKASDKAM